MLRSIAGAGVAVDVRREELNLLALRTPLYGLAGTSVLALVAIDFRSSLFAVPALLCLAIPLLYLLLHREAVRWKRRGGNQAFLRRSVLLLAVISMCWGVLLNLLIPADQSTKSNLVVGLVIALVSTPMATTPLSAAIAFWLPSAASGILVINSSEAHIDRALMVCYLGYVIFTFMATVLLNRSMLERAIGRIVLEKQNQTIGMFLRDYAENASDWLWETDQELRLRNVSPRMAEVARRPRSSLEGVSLREALRRGPDASAADTLIALLEERAAFRNVVVPVEIAGETRWWSVTGRPIMGDGALFEGYRGIGSDVTEIRRSEQRVRYLALHDSLTGLANRQSFIDSLLDACNECLRDAHGALSRDPAEPPMVAFLILDLDRFKSVNDSFGHAVGDTLLEAVAERLRGCLRKGTVVARLGGDEFGVMLRTPDAASCLAVCQRIIDTLNIDYALAGSRQSVGVSIGVSFLDHRHAVPAHWMRCADLALYAAKAAGRGVFRVFRPDMISEDDDRLSLRTDLKSAIVQGALRLAYQPIFHSHSDEIVCVEALCRWDHPALGPIPPSRFIRLAEETGMIAQLGGWALDEACRVASAWPDGVRIAVNVSPLQLRDCDFTLQVARALSESGLAAHRLELELTESAYLDAGERTLRTLHDLRHAGVRIVLDDFGTGYSALSYIASFQCDGVKIDASFIRDLESNACKAAVVRAIGQLAADLAIPVTAEGVETAEQLAMVRQLAVTQAQGYLLQRPTSEETIAVLLRRQDPSTLLSKQTAAATP